MKRIITTIITIYTFLSLCMGQNVTQDTVVVEDNSGVVEWVDVPDNNNNSGSRSNRITDDNASDINFGSGVGWISSVVILSIVSIVLSLGLPAIIIFLIFYFQYKNRKAKYKLAEQALASGQPIPEEVVKAAKEDDTNLQNKGIKNIFLGIGLCIFLWVFLSFKFGAIGLIIMFTGVGQLVIYFINKDKGNR